MNKRRSALIGVVIALVVVLSSVFIYVVYMNTPTNQANQFEQKLKKLYSGNSPIILFPSNITQQEINSALKTYRPNQPQYIPISETQFITQLESNYNDGYISEVARVGNTFYFLGPGPDQFTCYTP